MQNTSENFNPMAADDTEDENLSRLVCADNPHLPHHLYQPPSSDNTSSDNTSSDNTSSDNTSSDNTSSDNTSSDNANNIKSSNNTKLSDNTSSDSTSSDNPEEETILSEEEASFYTDPTVEYHPEAHGSILSHAVGFFSPGSFLLAHQMIPQGIAVNLILTFGIFAACGGCVYLDLFPVPILLTAAICVCMTWIYSCCHILRHPQVMVMDMVIAQMGIAFISFWMPFAIATVFCSNFILMRTWMGNDTMLPGIEKGDVLIVDRLEYAYKEPQYGDIVLIEENVREKGAMHRRAFLGRIIACPGDEVQLFGVQPSVNGELLSHYADKSALLMDNRSTASGTDDTLPMIAYELPFGTPIPESTEIEPNRWYPVMTPKILLFSQTNSVRLKPEYYYVLEDNRTASRSHAKASYGSIVHRSEIHGSPKYIIYNTEIENGFARYGTAVR